MKKEKTVKTHTRKTKSGKTVTVKQHTAKYDAAEDAREIVKRAGAGKELEKMKSSKNDPYAEYGFTAEEFAEWYEGTGSAADKKVEKALRKALGRKAYDELNDAAADGYKKGGAAGFFKKEVATVKPTAKETPAPKEPKAKKVKEETLAVKEKTPKSKKKGGSKEEFLLEYGEMPKYLKQYGGTQEDWASWMEGDSVAGGSYERMDKVADKALRAKYGKEWKKAKEYYEEMARLGVAVKDNFEPKGGSWGGVKPFESKLPSTKEPKTSKEPKEKHPSKLTDDEIREQMKKSGKYVFGRDGKIYYKLNGKRGWSISVDAYRKGLVEQYNERNATKALERYADEYGFRKDDIPTLASFGKSKPVRKFSEVSDTAARGYADFEDISFRTAKLELMMASKKEHDEWVAWGKKLHERELEGEPIVRKTNKKKSHKK